jgi:hypothetical protein
MNLLIKWRVTLMERQTGRVLYCDEDASGSSDYPITVLREYYPSANLVQIDVNDGSGWRNVANLYL